MSLLEHFKFQMPIALYWIVFLIINFFATPSPHIESCGCLCSSAINPRSQGLISQLHSNLRSIRTTQSPCCVSTAIHYQIAHRLDFLSCMFVYVYSTHPHVILYIK